MTKVIGITGSIGSGKSTVSRHLTNMGYYVIDCDKISHSVLRDNAKAKEEITNEFGTDIIDQDGYISRKKLGSIIFKDKDKRIKLNGILHPKIKEEVKKEIKESNNQIVFLDCPLLFETDFVELCDYKVVVYVDMDSQIRRIMARDNITFPEALNKINAQMPLKEKVELADYVIDNCHLEGDLDWQLTQLVKKIS